MRLAMVGALLAMGVVAAPPYAGAVQDSAEMELRGAVRAFAEIEFIDPPMVSLELPPHGADPFPTVAFKIVGNGRASVSMKPTEFMQVRDVAEGPAPPAGAEPPRPNWGPSQRHQRLRGQGEGPGSAVARRQATERFRGTPSERWNLSEGRQVAPLSMQQPWLGRMRHDDTDESIGYDLEVNFPDLGLQAGLPRDEPGGTPPIELDVAEQDGEVTDLVRVRAREGWTEDGERATAGTYRGAVTITVSAL